MRGGTLEYGKSLSHVVPGDETLSGKKLRDSLLSVAGVWFGRVRMGCGGAVAVWKGKLNPVVAGLDPGPLLFAFVAAQNLGNARTISLYEPKKSVKDVREPPRCASIKCRASRRPFPCIARRICV